MTRNEKVIALALNYLKANLDDVRELHRETPLKGFTSKTLPTEQELDNLIEKYEKK